MLAWLKFTFLSLFSNKISKEATYRKLWNMLFAFLMVLIIFTGLFSVAMNYSFNTHYKKASTFQTYSYNMFVNNENLSLEIFEKEEDGQTLKYLSSKNSAGDLVYIDSFNNAEDKTKYEKNNYNVIIDTRDSKSTYNEFTVSYIHKKDNSEIDHKTYLKATNKGDYNQKIDIKPTEVVLDDTIVNGYIETLKPIMEGIETEKTAKEEFKEIQAIETKDESYFKKVYVFYVKNYYKLSTVPTNKTYYQTEYVKVDDNNNLIYKNYVILTEDWALISFVNDKNVEQVFDGNYLKLNAGKMFSSNEDVDNFYNKVYSSVNTMRSVFIGFTVFRFFIFIIVALIVVSLLMYLLFFFRKNKELGGFFNCLKIASSYMIMASIISGVMAIILSFIISSQQAVSICLYLFLSIIGIRSLIFVIIELIKSKNAPVEEETNAASSQNYVPSKSISLSGVPTGTKVIQNENVSEDEEEKMELM